MKEEKILKRAAAYSTLLMLGVVTFSVGFHPSGENVSYASEIGPQVTQPPQDESVFSKTQENAANASSEPSVYDVLPYPVSADMLLQLGSNFIAIEKPDGLGRDYSISLNESNVDRKIELIIDHITDGYIYTDYIHRFYEGNYSKGMPKAAENSQEVTAAEKGEELAKEELPAEITDNMTSLKVLNSKLDAMKQRNCTITMELTQTYAYNVYEDDHYFYVSLKRPKDVYDKIIVLDAGHGGRDSGTYSKGQEYLEKDVNLDILLDLLEYLKQNEDIKVYVTRTTDRRLTLNQRVNLANDVEADFFLSIHCNSNESSAVNGTEVLFNDKQNDWEGMNSKRFSQICLEEMTKSMGLKNRGLVARSHDVHIIGQSQVPVALVEVAFMSNHTDLQFLSKDDNKKLAAEGIYHAILRAYDELQ